MYLFLPAARYCVLNNAQWIKGRLQLLQLWAAEHGRVSSAVLDNCTMFPLSLQYTDLCKATLQLGNISNMKQLIALLHLSSKKKQKNNNNTVLHADVVCWNCLSSYVCFAKTKWMYCMCTLEGQCVPVALCVHWLQSISKMPSCFFLCD